MEIHLSNAELERLMRPVEGQGGYQDLLRKLQNQVSGSIVTVTPEDRQRIKRYFKGQGGWQDRLAALAAADEPVGEGSL